MNNKRSFLSSIGLLLSFIGMAGLVLSIISLLPLNGYNIYTTVITSLKLLQFEHERTHEEWRNIELSQDAKIYLIFLTGSCFSSFFEILLTLIACCRSRTKTENIQGVTIIQAEEEEQGFLNNSKQQHKVLNRRSWFIRITCFTLLIQILFSLFGTHIIYKIQSDADVIPIEIQQNTFISCAILWINYLSLTLFAFVLLLASFFILISAYSRQLKHQTCNQNEETRPLIL